MSSNFHGLLQQFPYFPLSLGRIISLQPKELAFTKACLTRAIPLEVEAGMGGSERDMCDALLDYRFLRTPNSTPER
jgi:hypothetical protein